jgi:hypothetical protein
MSFVGCKVDDTEVGVNKYIKEGHLSTSYKKTRGECEV